MRKSANILSLPIISITEGRELGMSKTLVIDAKNGLIAAITIEDEEWYRGVKLIPYDSIIAIGNDAITILHSEKILKLSQVGDYEALLDENIKIIGTKAITKTGTIQGIVSEIFVGDNGRIEKCEIRASDGSTSEISADNISIFGKQVTVIDLNGVKKTAPIVKPVAPVVEEKPVEVVEEKPAEVPVVEEIPPEVPVVEEKPTEVVEEKVAEVEEKLAEVVEETPVEIPPAEEKPVEVPVVEENAAEVSVVEEKPAEESAAEDLASEEMPPVEDFEDEDVELPNMEDFEPEPEPEIDKNSMVPKQKGSTQQAEVLKAALKRAMENQQKNAAPTQTPAPKKGGKTVTLVGRKASKTITAENGSVIIEEGAEITEEVLQKARIANKFIELSMNSIA